MNPSVGRSVKHSVAANALLNHGHVSHHAFTDPAKASVGHKILHPRGHSPRHGVTGAIKNNIEHTALTHPSHLSHHMITNPVKFHAANKIINH